MSIDEMKRATHSGRGRLRSIGVVSVLALGLLAGTVYAGSPTDTAAWSMAESRVEQASESVLVPVPVEDAVDARSAAEPSPEIDELAERVERLAGGWAQLSEYYESNIAPIERVLLRYSRDTALVEHISLALVREAKKVQLEPRLLLAVLLVENPWLDPDIRSPVGAIGLMQVMPVHRGGWPECGTDLEDVDANICHGARIFAHYFEHSNRNLDRALLRYNGCVNGTNTPDCHQYPNHVFAHAGRASVMGWLDRAPTGGS